MNANANTPNTMPMRWLYVTVPLGMLALLLSFLFCGSSEDKQHETSTHAPVVIEVVPPALARFLLEVRESKFLDSTTPEALQAKRTELGSLINDLSGKQRDEARMEIQEANWWLEAYEIAATQMPESTEGRLGQFVSLDVLKASRPEDVPDALLKKHSQRNDEIVSKLKSELAVVVEDFKRGKTLVPESSLTPALMIANALAEQINEAEQNLPSWLAVWQEWRKRAEEQAASTEEADTKVDVTITNQLLQEGGMLEQQLIALNLPVPSDLVKATNDLRVRLTEAERKAINNYQMWALSEIQTVREMAGAKASARIEEALKAGKDEPGKTAKSAVYIQVLKEHPIFRSKLSEISGEQLDSHGNISPETVASISNRLWQIMGWKGLDDLSKCLNRDLLEQHLLKIDEALLRRPLDRLYSEVFDECWQYLEGTQHRVEVAKTAATIEKKPIIFPR